jgi:cysteine desulfurase
MIVYLDNASTTKPSEAAVAASLDALTADYGNPSSAHSMGQDAERMVKEARRGVACAIGARPERILFTGGGTEANNLALYSASRGALFGRTASEAAMHPFRIFTSPVEHPSVRIPVEYLAGHCAEAFVMPVDASGAVNTGGLADALDDALRSDAAARILISVMHVNNELGTIQPVAEIARIKNGVAAKTGAEILLHTDAVQSFCKLTMNMASAEGCGGFAGVDFAALSAHKVHGPKGAGALYAANPARISPVALGGGQEGGARSGTENVPGIAGFGAAVAEADDLGEAASRVAALRTRLLNGIIGAVPDVRVNGSAEASVTGEPGYCSPYILSVSFSGTRGEVILHDLESRGVFVSTGSACSNIGKGAKRQNPVLAAAGLTAAEAEGTIRFSLSRCNTEEEIDYVIECTEEAVKRFRKIGVFR